MSDFKNKFAAGAAAVGLVIGGPGSAQALENPREAALKKMAIEAVQNGSKPSPVYFSNGRLSISHQTSEGGRDVFVVSRDSMLLGQRVAAFANAVSCRLGSEPGKPAQYQRAEYIVVDRTPDGGIAGASVQVKEGCVIPPQTMKSFTP